MIPCYIGHAPVQILHQWNEITLSNAGEFYTLCRKMPKKLKEMYDIIREEEPNIDQWNNSLSKNDLRDFHGFYKDVLVCLSNIDHKTLSKTKPDQIESLYYQHLHQLTFGILNNGAGYDAKDIESFLFKGEFYYLPEGKNVMDFIIPMENLTAIQFTESNDLLKLVTDHPEGYKYVGAIIATLCNKKGEFFNEDVILKRAQEFGELKMDVVFDVFFCFLSSLIMPVEGLGIYSRGQVGTLRRPKNQALTKWVGMDRFLTWLGTPGI